MKQDCAWRNKERGMAKEIERVIVSHIRKESRKLYKSVRKDFGNLPQN